MGKIRRKTYLKKVGVIIISVMFFIGVGVGTAVCDNQEQDKIPNYTQMMSQDTTDTNGRVVKLDTEKESDQLNPVEREVIKEDTITSNKKN